MIYLVIETGSPESDGLALRKLLKDYNSGKEYALMLRRDHILIRADEAEFEKFREFLRTNTFAVLDYPLKGSDDVDFRNRIFYC